MIKPIKQLHNYKNYYKNNPIIMEIIINESYNIDEKLSKIKEHIIQMRTSRKNKHLNPIYSFIEKTEFEPNMGIEEADLILRKKKSEKYYERKKEYTKKEYHTNPEYNASIKLSNYKKYYNLYPEVKSIIENSDITKVEKLEQVRAFLKSLKQNKEK
jgi:hypothetical protein